jgi:site-specific DNA-cytosine methylase
MGHPLIAAAKSSPGKSADTLHGFLQLMAELDSEWALLENVDSLDDSSNRDALDALFQKRNELGYDTKSFVLDCCECQLPQRKERLYVICIKRPARSFSI